MGRELKERGFHVSEKKQKHFFTYMAWYGKTFYLVLSFSFLDVISVFLFHTLLLWKILS